MGCLSFCDPDTDSDLDGQCGEDQAAGCGSFGTFLAAKQSTRISRVENSILMDKIASLRSQRHAVRARLL